MGVAGEVGQVACGRGDMGMESNSRNNIADAKRVVGLRYSWKKNCSPPPIEPAMTYVPNIVSAIPTAIKAASEDRRIFTLTKKAPKMKYPA